MARMLQALKNLEARAPRPTVERLKEAEADRAKKPPAVTTSPVQPPAPPPPPCEPPAVKKAEPPPSAPPVNDVETPLDEPAALIRPLRRSDAPPAIAAPAASLTQSLVLTGPARWAAEPKAEAAPPTPPRKSSVNSRPPCAFERSLRRTLSDPVRSQPLVQLAERLQRDAEQSSSTTLVLVGVSPTAKSHETLAYAATLLAEKAPGDVLLVDADLGRKPLTAALEYAEDQGLAELLKSNDSPRLKCRRTAVPGLSILPAGLVKPIDVQAAESRLEQILKELAADFSYVLVAAGRTSDPPAGVLARMADATYFVVELGTVEASEAQAALRDFRAAGARVLGCIAT
jgi:Mrp family chromosome partitioning ATPase